MSRKPCHIQICVCDICAAFRMSTYRQRAVCQCWFLFKHSIAIALLPISKHKQTSVLFKWGHRISSELPPTQLGWQVDSLRLVANAFLETTSPTCSASVGVVVANSSVLCGVWCCCTLHSEPDLRLILDYFKTQLFDTTSPSCWASLGVVVGNSSVLCSVCCCYTRRPD